MEKFEIQIINDYKAQLLLQTKSRITKLFDTVDNIDHYFYGKRMRIFIMGCVWVLFIAPLLDSLLRLENDKITYLSTFILLFFIIVMILAFVSSWRDDNNNWTWKRAKSRMQTYYDIWKDEIVIKKSNQRDENIYLFGRYLFFCGIAWKAFQNLSVFIRKPIEGLLSIRLTSLRNFERFTNHHYWIIILLGLAIIIFLCKTKPVFFKRILNEICYFFGVKSNITLSKEEILVFNKQANFEYVINYKDEEHIRSIKSFYRSTLFDDFLVALRSWHPTSCHYEYEYQDRLYKHLRKHLKYATIDIEHPIGINQYGQRGRADIVINKTILIEMKRDISATAIKRAKGQILEYTNLWKDKGSIILLLCVFDYEHAQIAFSSFMNDLVALKRPVLTIVADPNSKHAKP